MSIVTLAVALSSLFNSRSTYHRRHKTSETEEEERKTYFHEREINLLVDDKINLKEAFAKTAQTLFNLDEEGVKLEEPPRVGQDSFEMRIHRNNNWSPMYVRVICLKHGNLITILIRDSDYNLMFPSALMTAAFIELYSEYLIDLEDVLRQEAEE